MISKIKQILNSKTINIQQEEEVLKAKTKSTLSNNKCLKMKQKNQHSNIILIAICSLVMMMLVLAQAEHHEDHKHHKFNPYKYGYKVIDHKGNKQWKHEESHHPMEVKGSYGYKDKHGLFREVSYIADKHGFRAHVKTNEPGTAPKSSAGVKMDAHPDSSFHKQSHGHHH